jgi:hypothetical protein
VQGVRIARRYEPAGIDAAIGADDHSLPPYEPWQRFIATHAFRPGEHVTAIGRTGRGKTTLIARGLLPGYPYVLYLGSKEYDRSAYPWLLSHGYRMTADPKLNAASAPHVIYRPGPFGVSERERELLGDRMALVLDVAYRQRAWTIYADELAFLVDQKPTRIVLEHIWRTGRGLERKVDGKLRPAPVTLIVSTQNPVDVPRVAFDQISHLFIWRQTERERAVRIAEMIGQDRRLVQGYVMRLPEFEALYVNTTTDEMVRTRYPL